VIVDDSIHDELVSRLATSLAQLKRGTNLGSDVGRLISATQCALIESQVDDAVARGATVAARIDPDTDARKAGCTSLFILTDVTPEMRVWHEETFGPVLAVVRARDEREAVEMANDSRYGLSASVWSSDRKRGRRIASQIEAGAVCINDVVANAGIPEVAHGGVKSSGMGRVHGIEGLRECVRTRVIIEDILPNRRQAWWFGYGANGYDRIDSYLQLTHGSTFQERIRGLPGTLRMMFSPERPL
jgi:succinate-semialdehyde dehydrogenase/glutarate-semialdehyde dehydrogenase